MFAACRHFPAIRLDGDEIWGFKEIGQEGGYPHEFPEVFGIRAMFTDLCRRASRDGCRVILHGEGGDAVTSYESYWHTEYLLDLDPGHVLDEMGYFWKRLRLPQLQSWPRQAVRQLVPDSMADLLRKSMGRNSPRPWLKNGAFDGLPPVDLPVDFANTEHLNSRSSKNLYSLLHTRGLEQVLRYLDSIWASRSVEFRFPFLDRRLIELSLSMPTHLLLYQGFDRGVLRRSND